MGIVIVVKAEDLHKRNVVYRIDFGDYFYIGYTKYVKTRMYHHQLAINKLLKAGEAPDHYMLLVIEHLKWNFTITEGIVTILHTFPDSTHHILHYEQECVKEGLKTGFCLNRPNRDPSIPI